MSARLRLRLPMLMALVACCLAGALHGQEKLLLRQHWEAGKVYHYDIAIDAETKGGPAGNASTSLLFQIEVTVRGEAGTGTRHAEVKTTSIKSISETGGDLKTYDFAHPGPGDASMHKEMARLFGKSFTLVYDADDQFKTIILPENSELKVESDDRGPGAEFLLDLLTELMTGGLPSGAVTRGEEFTGDRTFIVMKADDAILISVQKKQTGKLQGEAAGEGRREARVLATGSYEMGSRGFDGPNRESPRVTFQRETLFDLDQRVVRRSTLEGKYQIPGLVAEMTAGVSINVSLKKVEAAPAVKK